VENWLDPEAVPKGQAQIRSQKNESQVPLQAVLIVYGRSLCRLEDISDDGKWLRDVEFKASGKVIKRSAGESARGAMRQWVALRQQLGWARLQSLRVWTQAAAWADEVISVWISDLVSEYLHQSINVVDCFSGQWTENCLWTSWLNQQFQIPNGPDTTPILQLADTCCIAVGKTAGEKCKDQLALQLREKAKREGAHYKAQFGQYEIFSVAEALCSEPQKRQSSRDVILAQCMKSQLLVIRPDSSGRLRPVEDEPWAAQLPRYPVKSGLQPSWVAQRSSHLQSSDSHGLFCPVPDWNQLNEGAFDQSCFSNEPVGEELVLECLPDSVLADLTVEDRELLKSPQERWASLNLPRQLKSQVLLTSAC
jgi:hypothetical protein